MPAAILNLVSFYSDKPEKINQSRFFLAVGYEHCATINHWVMRIETNLLCKSSLNKTDSRGLRFRGLSFRDLKSEVWVFVTPVLYY